MPSVKEFHYVGTIIDFPKCILHLVLNIYMGLDRPGNLKICEHNLIRPDGWYRLRRRNKKRFIAIVHIGLSCKSVSQSNEVEGTTQS